MPHASLPRLRCFPLIQTGAVILVIALCSGCDSWETGKRESAQERSILRGKMLMTQYQCGSCHAIPGVADARGVKASSLRGFGRRSYIAGRIPNQPATLAAWILNPNAMAPSATMPALGVSPSDAHDMAAYLGTLQ